LLFTRLDETDVYGAMLGLSVRMGIPFSFLSNRQRVPVDMVPASSDLLLGFIDDIPSGSVRAGMVAA
jgi:flagellar biosynthesis GTPase FlhF